MSQCLLNVFLFPKHSSTYKLFSSSADETLPTPKLKGDFCYITCLNGGCEGDLCSASVDSLGCLLPYLISWGLTYVHRINRFCRPLNFDSVWLVATTSRISERESLTITLLAPLGSGHCQISCVSEGDVSWQLALPVQLLSPNFCLLLLA